MQSLGPHLFNMEKKPHNITFNSIDKAIFTFQNLVLKKGSLDEKCHFAISEARPVCKSLKNYSEG